MDTANYEPENTDVEWRQFTKKGARRRDSRRISITAGNGRIAKVRKAGLTALLGCGFDPGVTQAYCAYAKNMSLIPLIR